MANIIPVTIFLSQKIRLIALEYIKLAQI
ncbi:uncharacterized protein METZ01_LOCUS462028 [marine metagenome]|uniref:Uncharacterized protein n=1 Tax=marine metagenome TaxID=408172 RepID=A0A383ANB0_9ZZZZ